MHIKSCAIFCVDTCLPVHVHVQTYICTCTCMYTNTICTCTCTYRYMYINRCRGLTLHTCMYTCTSYTCTYMYMYTCIYSLIHVYVHVHVHVVHGLMYLQVVVVEEEGREVSQLPELRTEVLDGASDLQLRPLISLLFLRGLLTPHTNCPCGWEHRNVR